MTAAAFQNDLGKLSHDFAVSGHFKMHHLWSLQSAPLRGLFSGFSVLISS
jgi:hypothetical protein